MRLDMFKKQEEECGQKREKKKKMGENRLETKRVRSWTFKSRQVY